MHEYIIGYYTLYLVVCPYQLKDDKILFNLYLIYRF